MNKAVEEYWSRSEFGRMILREPDITERDLLLFMPNNAKKMRGLPMSRSNGKRKAALRKKKVRRMEAIVFSVVEKMIEETLPRKMDEMFSSFASAGTLQLGD